jgi:hypothetical protein
VPLASELRVGDREGARPPLELGAERSARSFGRATARHGAQTGEERGFVRAAFPEPEGTAELLQAGAAEAGEELGQGGAFLFEPIGEVGPSAPADDDIVPPHELAELGAGEEVEDFSLCRHPAPYLYY